MGLSARRARNSRWSRSVNLRAEFLRHDVRRITSHLTITPADAWVIESGSRELLEWCAAQELPCMALYGRSGGLPLARTGPDKVLAYRAATRQLLEFGHRRIVLIVRAGRRLPTPGNCESALLLRP